MRTVRRLTTIVFTLLFMLPFREESNLLYAQFSMPLLFGQRGDTITYSYPPPPSSYVPDELIIKFRKGALDYSRLCYECPSPAPAAAPSLIDPSPDPSCRASLMADRFDVDGGVVLSAPLVAAMSDLGGVRLRRITIANPCRDTLSLTRRGDTLRMDDFNWMVLELDNDTSVITAALRLTINFQDQIELAEPNYHLIPLSTPSDYYFAIQTSLEMIGMEKAWDHATGSPAVRVGVIDDGIDYLHCDLGGALGVRVKGGRQYVPSVPNVRDFARHGTPCAGIIGAYTNRQSCVGATPSSSAGIAGGWGPDNGSGTDNPGVSLWAYAFISAIPGNTDRAVAAIREASVYGIKGGYGDAMHVLNFSAKVAPDEEADIRSSALESALNTAYEHGVTFVAARGNDGDQEPDYPACYADTWVTSVGGSQRSKEWHEQSSYGMGMDLIAPYGGNNFNPPESEKTVFTTAHTGLHSEEPGKHDYFEGTSAAAPHVSGVMALLRSYLPEALDPEDYEGMVQASAKNIGDEGYDELSGWGHLQADNLFTMLGENSYRITNFTVAKPTAFGEWSGELPYYFTEQQEINKPLDPGAYRVRRREVTATFDLRDYGSWSRSYDVYAWGRGGNKASGGFSAANPNYQDRWTEVTSGDGGNGFTEGILHGKSDICTARTFQYEVRRFNRQSGMYEYLGLFPADEELAFHITVFAVPLVTSVRVAGAGTDEMAFAIAPNPAAEEANISYTVHRPGGVRISLLNTLGEEVQIYPERRLEPGRYESRLNLANMAAGIYYCRVETGDEVAVRPLIIAR